MPASFMTSPETLKSSIQTTQPTTSILDIQQTMESPAVSGGRAHATSSVVSPLPLSNDVSICN